MFPRISPLSGLKSFVKRVFLSKKYGVCIGTDTRISMSTVFEGKSVVNDHCHLDGSFIGMGTYIANNSRFSRTLMGRFCSIGQNVQCGFGLHPSNTFVSTHPSFFSLEKQAGFTFVERSLFEEHRYVQAPGLERDRFQVVIGNDVWISNDVRIMDGVTIGDGAIIGLGAIVTKDVEPYSINVGLPARKIGYRFTKDQICFLLRFKWWDKDFDWIKKNAALFVDIETFQSTYGADS